MRRLKVRTCDLLLGLGAWLALLGPLGRDNYVCDDLWGKLSIPAVWLATGKFPYLDRFSYTAWGGRWVDHEWLSGVVFYATLAVGGDAGLSLLKALMIGVLIAGAFWTARLHRLSVLWPAGLLLLGMPHLHNSLAATGRPQLFTFCLLPGLLAFLEWVRLTKGLRRLWVVPVVGALWANAHGGFVTGLAMVLCYALGEALRGKPWKPYLAAAAAWAAATLLNPYGLGYWRFLAYALSLPRPEITEWGAVLLWDTECWGLKLSILTAAVAIALAFERCRVQRRSWRELPWPQILILVVSFWQAFRAFKLTSIGVLSAACCVPPLLAWALPGRLEDPEAGVPRSLAAVGLAAAVLWASGCWFIMHPRFQPWRVQVRDNGYPVRYRQGKRPYPVEAVRFLEESGGCGNLLSPFTGGEFVYWRLYPRFRVSIDGRLECVYPMESFRRELDGAWEGSLDTPALKQADWVLIERNIPLYGSLLDSPRWEAVHRDDTYAVFKRLPPGARRSAPPAVQAPPPGAAGWAPVSAYFHPRQDLQRFKAYADEDRRASPRDAACRPLP